MNGGYESAKKLLSKNRETLERIALALLEREVIDANEVKLLMEGKPLPEKPRTPPTPPQTAPSADPKVMRPELRPAPGFTWASCDSTAPKIGSITSLAWQHGQVTFRFSPSFSPMRVLYASRYKKVGARLLVPPRESLQFYWVRP